MGNQHSCLVDEKDTMSVQGWGLNAAGSSSQGYRRDQEDRFGMKLNIFTDTSFFYIMDGHGGSFFSQGASDQLLGELKKHLSVLSHANSAIPPETIASALRDSFFSLDASLLKQRAMSNEIHGSTAVAVVVTRLHVIIANLGDSSCFMMTPGGEVRGGMEQEKGKGGFVVYERCVLTARPLYCFCQVFAQTSDHKPDAPGELARIVGAGGTVTHHDGVARIEGALAVSRAFGNSAFKGDSTLSPSQQKVSSEADVTVMVCAGWKK
jgi:serine/threonine protein phosphatase PrpC